MGVELEMRRESKEYMRDSDPGDERGIDGLQEDDQRRM